MQAEDSGAAERQRLGDGGGSGVSFLSCNRRQGATALSFLSPVGPQEGLGLRASPGRAHQVVDALREPLRQNLPTPTTSAAPSAAAT